MLYQLSYSRGIEENHSQMGVSRKEFHKVPWFKITLVAPVGRRNAYALVRWADVVPVPRSGDDGEEKLDLLWNAFRRNNSMDRGRMRLTITGAG